MLATALIDFREVLEAALIVAIVLGPAAASPGALHPRSSTRPAPFTTARSQK